jgi:hypothetical protein
VTAHDWTVALVRGMWSKASESGNAVRGYDPRTL